MLFNSFDFLVFFPVVILIYFLLPSRYRWIWLFLASCYFYIYVIPAYILVLFLVILIDYAAGILIENSGTRALKRTFLIISILSTCTILFVFKYFNFFNASVTNLAHFLGWHYSLKTLSLILPIGLSFHTFQSLSYVIEVYKGRQKAERHLGRYGLYVMFFPQLVAGPIERPQHLLHQLDCKSNFAYARVTDGLKLMFWGFFKKVVIADRLAVVINIVYGSPHEFSGMVLIIGTVFFAFQIYCDFSGYTDIARGSARVMGIELMENFNVPYHARSIQEFWQRWHISLSTWFKDYVYIPLGGNRVPWPRMQLNIMVTFLLSGLWHGANWTFVIWGLLHGFYYVVSSMFSKIKLPSLLQIILTFSLVCLAWVFFRANTLDDALYIITHLGKGMDHVIQNFHELGKNADVIGLRNVGLGKIEYVKNFFLIAFLTLVGRLGSSDMVMQWVNSKKVYLRWLLYYVMIIWLIFWGEFGPSQFIYFQF